jgi:hypothetical protein
METTRLGICRSLHRISLPSLSLQSGSLHSSHSIPTNIDVLLRVQSDLKSMGSKMPMNKGSCIDDGQ